jgi:ParB/RepB/Spo0J family partition protein
MSQLSEEALASDKNTKYQLVPRKKIYVDTDFNSRGVIDPMTLMELANDIQLRGLVEPIVLRPLWDSEQAIKDQGYEYSLVAGFRRTGAYDLLKAEAIPAVIKDLKSDFDCRDINAVENLQRNDLTFWQECATIRHYWAADWTRKEIANRISKSEGWVQVRIMLLEMPTQIQEWADAGYLVASDIRELYKFVGTERLVMAGRLVDARKKDSSVKLVDRLRKKENPNTRKHRKPVEIFELMNSLRASCKQIDRDQEISLLPFMSEFGNSILTKLLAWCAGELTNMEIHLTIQEFCRLCGADHDIPSFEESNLD